MVIRFGIRYRAVITNCRDAYWFMVQWVPQLFKCLEFFQVNKSCKIDCRGVKTHQIIHNMILCRGLELRLRVGPKSDKMCESLHPLYFIETKGSHTVSHL